MDRTKPKPPAAVSETLSSQEARDILRLAAEPYGPHDNKKSLIVRAAGVLGLSYRRAKAFWYGEEFWPLRAEEVIRLRAERERLYQRRLARLLAEIMETDRLISEARNRHEATVAVDRRAAEPAGQMVLPLGRRSPGEWPT